MLIRRLGFVYNDDAHENCPHETPSRGACVARAIARLTTKISYHEIYKEMCRINAIHSVDDETCEEKYRGVETCFAGTYTGNDDFKKFADSIGFKKVYDTEWGPSRYLSLSEAHKEFGDIACEVNDVLTYPHWTNVINWCLHDKLDCRLIEWNLRTDVKPLFVEEHGAHVIWNKSYNQWVTTGITERPVIEAWRFE